MFSDGFAFGFREHRSSSSFLFCSFVGLGQARLCHRNKINSTSVPVGLLALGRAGGLHFDISFHPPTLSSRCGGSCPPCGSLVFARTAWTLPSIPDLPRRPRTPIVRSAVRRGSVRLYRAPFHHALVLVILLWMVHLPPHA